MTELQPIDPSYSQPRNQTNESHNEGNDSHDGWTSGGRAPPSGKDELKYYMRCESLCCSISAGNWCYERGMNRCFCCFDRCYAIVRSNLISDGYDGPHDTHMNRMAETEEWFRGFNCWPLPLLTLTMCAIETYYYVTFSTEPDYIDALLDSNLAWTARTKNETHRWFTYSFLHGGTQHFCINILLQIMVGLLIEMEHKWVRLTFIYVIGVVSGSLFHSVVSPCASLVGASGGIFALLGAGAIKLKRHRKYQGRCRQIVNLALSAGTLILALSDLGFSIYAWYICDTNVKKTAISAHMGGFVSGLAVGYLVLNKYQESWGQQMMRNSRKYQDIRPEDTRCCNIGNFYTAYIHNPDLKKQFNGWRLIPTIISILIVPATWAYCIYWNMRNQIIDCSDHCK